MSEIRADVPMTADGRTYHLHTKAGEVAPYCLLVGSPERAEMIAQQFFRDPKEVGNYRGLRSFTGKAMLTRLCPPLWKGRSSSVEIPMSVVTTGMGGPTTGIVLREAVYSGAESFIRVGSCSALQREPKPGESIIWSGAVRYEGTSHSWAPPEYPAVANWQVVSALTESAIRQELPHHTGIGATTDCFYEGQARPDPDGYVPPEMLKRHDWLVRNRVMCYSMEEATIFVWCSMRGIPAGAVDAIFGNRITNEWAIAGEEESAQIAIGAFFLMDDLTHPAA